MENKTTSQMILELELKIAAGMTTAADVELLHLIFEQISYELIGGNDDLP